ncbi:MAG TPA: DMT family transporter [Candidatus Intestinimonas stercorigallinarum]|nr:DMT family transporter [Candidatus Intestinimonas stercorigallinarum]
MSRRLRADPRLVLFLGVLGASFSAIFVRWSQAPSLVTATGRLGWTVLLLLPAVLRSHRAELRAATRRDLLLCALSGACLALHFSTWFESLKWTSIASSTVLVSTEVIFSALGFALFLHGRVPKLGVAAIALAFAGSVALALADAGGGGALAGDLLAVLAAAAVAVYTLIGQVQRSRQSTTVYTFLTYTACLLVLLALDAATGTPVLGWGLREAVVGLLLAVFCTLLGHSLFSWSLKWLSPAYVSAAKLCEPVFASVLGLLLFGEGIGPLQGAGAAAVLAGVLLYTKAEGRRP